MRAQHLTRNMTPKNVRSRSPLPRVSVRYDTIHTTTTTITVVRKQITIRINSKTIIHTTSGIETRAHWRSSAGQKKITQRVQLSPTSWRSPNRAQHLLEKRATAARNVQLWSHSSCMHVIMCAPQGNQQTKTWKHVMFSRYPYIGRKLDARRSLGPEPSSAIRPQARFKADARPTPRRCFS